MACAVMYSALSLHSRQSLQTENQLHLHS